MKWSIHLLNVGLYPDFSLIFCFLANYMINKLLEVQKIYINHYYQPTLDNGYEICWTDFKKSAVKWVALIIDNGYGS